MEKLKKLLDRLLFPGAAVVVLSVPCRYIHSPSSVVKLSDVESQFALVKALVKAL